MDSLPLWMLPAAAFASGLVVALLAGLGLSRLYRKMTARAEPKDD